ncbi:MAG: hypothetical protein LC128_06115 [Chitinophagales bacterium]|nr:hypothetical protein [Chitinophagales bacterium]
MKRLLMILMATVVSMGLNAQHAAPVRTGHVGHGNFGRTRIVVVGPSFYSPFYYGSPYLYGYYDPFYYPFYPGNVYQYPGQSKLELKIANIKNDYRDKIWSARHDKDLSKTERKDTIHQLKHDRDQAIIQAQTDYYKSH